MIDYLKNWYARFFADPDSVILFLFIAIIITFMALFGSMLMPVLASVVVAYLLSGVIDKLEEWRVPHLLAVMLVYFSFIGLLLFAIVGVLPPLWRQAASFFQNLPNMLTQGQELLSHLPEKYPDIITPEQISHITQNFQSLLGSLGQQVLSYSLSTLSSLINIVLYFVLVPFLVYFFLVDRDKIVKWSTQYLPRNRRILSQVWSEVNKQFGNYIQGRVLEILIVTVVTYIAFLSLGLDYAMLLSFAVGISVIIPYIGAVIATIPVLFIGILQWGWSTQFIYLAVIYGVITILSGYVLEPILFSEALDLHPIAIIVAMLFFGGLWGFWGIFFSIPLATVVRAVINAWPRSAQPTALSS